MDVLSRLPAKPLITVSSFRKTWNSLIRHPAFITKHLRSQSSTSHLLIVPEELFSENPCTVLSENNANTRWTSFPFPFKTESMTAEIVGSCNGLFGGAFMEEGWGCGSAHWSVAFAKGAVHWLVSMKAFSSFQVILAFDLEEEVFREMKLPPKLLNRFGESMDSDSFRIKEFQESIAQFVYRLRGDECCYVWWMREYGEAKSWTKQFTIVPRGRWSGR
ncbi:hypothetical protein Acr_00g0007920 [Actinidia rufa]|uniref:F-box family protein n=1 Tax=Actinidia rufa TaxID=165716 RepID=A0A7J0D9X6_9ERIC|nr:hypothetical protein Acr_00g0007920 [Actinidia rufa]